jgi:L-lactate permease
MTLAFIVLAIPVVVVVVLLVVFAIQGDRAL